MDIKVDSNTVVCFDLDDTLYNEIDFLKSAYIEIAQKLNKEDWKALYAKMFSLYRQKKDVFAFLTTNFSKSSKEDLLVVYRDHSPSITLFPHVLAIFQTIKKYQGHLAIITDGRSITQRNKIKNLGILPYVDYIVISDEIGTEKPNEANFKVIEKKFEGARYYYIGDNFKKDFIIPNEREWISVGLADNGLNIHNNTFDFFTVANAPKHIITSYMEVCVLPL